MSRGARVFSSDSLALCLEDKGALLSGDQRYLLNGVCVLKPCQHVLLRRGEADVVRFLSSYPSIICDISDTTAGADPTNSY